MNETTLRKIIKEELASAEAKSLPELLTTEEVSDVLKVKVGTLGTWRYKGIGPNYLKVCGVVLYKKSDISKFLEGSAEQPQQQEN